MLFENQAELSDQKIKEISELLGLDWEKLSKDMQDPEIIAMITRDKSEGDRARLSQIPTIFLNGRRLKHLSFQGFRAVIEYELQKFDKRAGAAVLVKSLAKSGIDIQTSRIVQKQRRLQI